MVSCGVLVVGNEALVLHVHGVVVESTNAEAAAIGLCAPSSEAHAVALKNILSL